MPDIWTLLAYQLVAILSGVATAGLSLVLGGLGGQFALARRLAVLEDRADDLDVKITREVKRRAADAATAARSNAKSVETEAAELIASAKAGRDTGARRRPSIAQVTQ